MDVNYKPRPDEAGGNDPHIQQGCYNSAEGNALPERENGNVQVVWFHGTTPENAALIEREGFKEGTWFARHMEDALEFGGPCIFWVKVSFADKYHQDWQVCCMNVLPVHTIVRRADFRPMNIGSRGRARFTAEDKEGQ
jgi:hypothetical protein